MATLNSSCWVSWYEKSFNFFRVDGQTSESQEQEVCGTAEFRHVFMNQFDLQSLWKQLQVVLLLKQSDVASDAC